MLDLEIFSRISSDLFFVVQIIGIILNFLTLLIKCVITLTSPKFNKHFAGSLEELVLTVIKPIYFNLYYLFKILKNFLCSLLLAETKTWPFLNIILPCQSEILSYLILIYLL